MIYVLTIGHKRFDTRIWVKQIASLKTAGLHLRYIVADGVEDETVAKEVEIHDYGPIPDRSGFKRRMGKMYEIVSEGGMKRGDVVHFHAMVPFLPFAVPALVAWMQSDL